MKRLEKAIAVLRFLLKKKKDHIESMSRKIAPTNTEKVIIGQEQELVDNVEILISEVSTELKTHLGKLPPQDVNLEETILGAIILEPLGPMIRDTELRGPGPMDRLSFLTEDHFHLQTNKTIYQHLRLMHIAREPIDMRTIVAKIRRAGKLEEIGGAHHIAEICARVSSAANVEYHARILVEFAMKRELIRLAGDMLYKGYDDTVDAIELMDEVEKRVNQIGEWRKK